MASVFPAGKYELYVLDFADPAHFMRRRLQWSTVSKYSKSRRRLRGGNTEAPIEPIGSTDTPTKAVQMRR